LTWSIAARGAGFLEIQQRKFLGYFRFERRRRALERFAGAFGLPGGRPLGQHAVEHVVRLPQLVFGAGLHQRGAPA